MKVTETPRPPLVTTRCLLCGKLVELGDDKLNYREVMVQHLKDNHRGDNALFAAFLDATERLELHCPDCATDVPYTGVVVSHNNDCPVFFR